MQRVAMLLALALCLAATGGAATAARSATPEAGDSALAAMGYPELAITVSEKGFDLPGEVAAGRTLITLENVGAESRHSLLLRLPDNVTVGELQIDPESEEPPAWFFQAQFVGFPGETLPGATNRAVVDLTPGLYVIVDDFSRIFVVTPNGEDIGTPAVPVDPAAATTVSLFEYGFQFPNVISPGRQVWQIVNAGREPHELLLAKAPAGTTADQVLELLTNESDDENATPAGGGPRANQIIPVGGLGWLSQGGTAWTEVTLDAGTYVALCFVFDPATGMPHAAMGMVDVFSVS